MTFNKDDIQKFLVVFNESKDRIRSFPGCDHVDLLQDVDHTNVFSTYSHWESVEDLDKYRSSEFFRGVWGKTRVLFSEKPKAHSYQIVD